MNLKSLMVSPVEFRRHLMIDTDRGPVVLADVLDDWQREDFEALDPGWQRVAGRKVTTTNTIYRRAYLERPRGHAKTSDLAVMVGWVLFASQRRVSGVCAAADRDQAKLLRDAIERLAELNPWLGKTFEIQSWRIINKHTKSELSIISSDSGSSFGLLVDFVAIDELSNWSLNEGEELWGSLISAAAKKSNCIVVVISNAGLSAGGSSWIWRARESFRENSGCFFSRLDGPQASWITPDRLEEQRQLLPKPAHDRLWLNIWSTSGSDLFSDVEVTSCLTLPGPCERERGWTYVAGLDLATTRDTAALCIIGKRGQRYRLARCLEWRPTKGRRISLEEIGQAVIEAHREYKLHRVAVDPWQASLLCELLRKAGVPINEQPQTGGNLVKQCGALLEAIQTRSVELYDFRPLVDDLRSLRIEEKAYGCRLVPQRDGTGHGDRAVSLSIALAIAKDLPANSGEPWAFIGPRPCVPATTLRGVPEAGGSRGMYGEDFISMSRYRPGGRPRPRFF
jgi:phage terminase large subunit-like protein